MKNVKHFEGYNEKNCEAELTILHWGKDNGSYSNTYRLLVKLKSPSGTEFNVDGTGISEVQAKKLINDFGATVEERY